METEKNVDIKLIVTDLDETALRRDKSCSQRTKDAFASCRKAGVKTAIATARTALSAKRQAAILGTEYIICSNGSRLLERENPIWETSFDADLTDEMIRRLKALPSIQDISVETAKTVYHNRKRLPPGHAYHDAVLYDFDEALHEEGYQILTGIADEQDAQKFLEQFPECACIHYRETTRYAFVRRQVSKAQTLKILAEHLGISLAEAAAFGDDLGDLVYCTDDI